MCIYAKEDRKNTAYNTIFLFDFESYTGGRTLCMYSISDTGGDILFLEEPYVSS